MAISKGILKMSGAFGTASCYFLPGSDKMIVRAKGGPSARRMKVGPEFEKVRKHQKEWKACVIFSRYMQYASGSIYNLADYNVSPVWNGLGKNIIKTDTEHSVGERNLLVSTCKSELQGFNLNKNYKLNALLGVLPVLELDPDKLYASATFPAFNSAQDILNVRKLPYFKLKICLGIISDILFTPDDIRDCYKQESNMNGFRMETSTEWLSTNDKFDAQKLEVQYEQEYVDMKRTNLTYLLSMGIEFGNVGFGGKIESVKYAGAGKIVKVG